MIEGVSDASDAQWVLDRLDAFKTHCVGAVVPRGFKRYARMFHPGYRGPQRIPVRWDDVARITGVRAHRLMRWKTIRGDSDLAAPREGSLPVWVSDPLHRILPTHTESKHCWLAVWRGYGWDYRSIVLSPTCSIATTARDWDLFRAPLRMMDVNLFELADQTANMIWPDDRNWFLATDIDLNTTYIGGSEALVQALLDADDLEVREAQPTDSL